MYIDKKRKECKMTQKELAAKLNVTQGAISQWEQGLVEPSLKYIVLMAKIFGCTVDELVGAESVSLQSTAPGDALHPA